jgi:hypothetical protein
VRVRFAPIIGGHSASQSRELPAPQRHATRCLIRVKPCGALKVAGMRRALTSSPGMRLTFNLMVTGRSVRTLVTPAFARGRAWRVHNLCRRNSAFAEETAK